MAQEVQDRSPRGVELAILDVVRDFSKIRSIAKQAGFSQDVQDGVNHIESLYDVAKLGAKAYAEKEIMFKSTTQDMVKAIMKMKEDTSGGQVEAEKFHKAVIDMSLSVQQRAVWSDTPAHDRVCVEFDDILGVVARLGHKADHIGHCVPADYQPDASLHAAMQELCQKETSKPKLLWLLGDELTMAFLTFADAMFEAVAPANADHAKDQSGNPCRLGTATSAAYFKKPLAFVCDSPSWIPLPSTSRSRQRDPRRVSVPTQRGVVCLQRIALIQAVVFLARTLAPSYVQRVLHCKAPSARTTWTMAPSTSSSIRRSSATCGRNGKSLRKSWRP
jgi:hypothetical protein